MRCGQKVYGLSTQLSYTEVLSRNSVYRGFAHSP